MDGVPEKRVLDLAHSCSHLSGEALRAFLDRECAGDESLRSRVEEAVRQIKDVIPTDGFRNDYERVLPDHYKLIEMVGRGGMAEVFRAEDSRLGRSVAIKFLSTEFRRDAERMRRFNQEARAASALNHPNIITIHDIGERDGVQYIVTEFVEGETLNARIRRGKLPVAEAVDIAIQVASALAASHKAGIVHRDIKPDNVMIRKDGVVKVLDFGLAKETLEISPAGVDVDAATLDKVLTSPGLIMGTPQYMSPEQARGSHLDPRTDIFSLGIIIFEMAAGEPPFAGPSMVDVIAAIIGKEPRRLEQFVDDPPVTLIRIVQKTLRKDRTERYGMMDHLLSDLRDLKQELTTQSHEFEQQTEPAVPRATLQHTIRTVAARIVRWDLLATVAAAAVLGVGAWWFVSSRQSPATALTGSLRSVPVTSWSAASGDIVAAASFSPDGRMIAFAATRSGSSEIWVKPAVGGDAIPVTKNSFFNMYPVWSPNGEEIAFFSTRGANYGLWRASFTGGDQTQVLANIRDGARVLYWAPSGRIYFQENSEIYYVDEKSSQRAAVTDFAALGVLPRALEISADERMVAYSIRESDAWKVKVLDVGSTTSRDLASSKDQIEHLAWVPDGSAVMFSAVINGSFQIFRVDLKGGEPIQLSTGDMDFNVLDVSTDGGRVLYGSVSETSDLWRIDTADARESLIANEVPAEYWPDVSPDGDSIVFQSVSQAERAFGGSLNVRQASGSGAMLTVAASGFLPTWSPDGKWIAYMSRTGSAIALSRVRSSGDDTLQLASGRIGTPGYLPTPYIKSGRDTISWSPDSKFVAYSAIVDGISNIWLAAVDGSGVRPATKNLAASDFFGNPTWTADGKIIARVDAVPPGGKRVVRLSLIDPETGTSETIFEDDLDFNFLGLAEDGRSLLIAQRRDRNDISVIPQVTTIFVVQPGQKGVRTAVQTLDRAYSYNIHLSRDGRNIAFVTRRDSVTALWTVPVKGGTPKQLLVENDPKVMFSSVDWAPDGSYVVFGKQTRTNLISMLAK